MTIEWEAIGWNFQYGDQIHGSVLPTNSGWLIRAHKGVRPMNGLHDKIFPTESEAKAEVRDFLLRNHKIGAAA